VDKKPISTTARDYLLFLQWATCEQQLEGRRSRLERTVKKPHQSIYQLIDDFKGEQDLTEVTLQQLSAGANPPPRKKYRQLNKRVERIKENLHRKLCYTYLYYPWNVDILGVDILKVDVLGIDIGMIPFCWIPRGFLPFTIIFALVNISFSSNTTIHILSVVPCRVNQVLVMELTF